MLRSAFTVGALIVAFSGAASAHDFHIQPSRPGVAVHPYTTVHHYCPYGTQPVSVGGEISCGVPTYQRNVVIVAPTYQAATVIVQPNYTNRYNADTRPVSVKRVYTPSYTDKY